MTAPIDPLDPWAGDVPPVPVDPPQPDPNGPPVLPPPVLPPAPGLQRTWADVQSAAADDG